MDPSLFNASYAAGAQGIVVAGVGAGGTSAKAATAAEALFNATGMPIVASRRSVDGFVSDGDDYRIAAGFYNPQKARILLQLAVSQGLANEDIKEVFGLGYPAL